MSRWKRSKPANGLERLSRAPARQQARNAQAAPASRARGASRLSQLGRASGPSIARLLVRSTSVDVAQVAGHLPHLRRDVGRHLAAPLPTEVAEIRVVPGAVVPPQLQRGEARLLQRPDALAVVGRVPRLD